MREKGGIKWKECIQEEKLNINERESNNGRIEERNHIRKITRNIKQRKSGIK